MRKLLKVIFTAVWALVAAPISMLSSANAAEIVQYTPPPPVYDLKTLPEVDYGLTGNFYLRGSVAGAIWQASDGSCTCIATFSAPGYGYSVGVGFGYETGEGLRADVTVDYVSINGLTANTTNYNVNLRSGIMLANVYYDFNLGDYGSLGGGFGAYVGAGIGVAKNFSYVTTAAGAPVAWGRSMEGAAAVMAGVSYDMGDMVAELGYRGIYMNKVMSQPPLITDTYIISNNLIHEARASLRYRLY